MNTFDNKKLNSKWDKMVDENNRMSIDPTNINKSNEVIFYYKKIVRYLMMNLKKLFVQVGENLQNLLGIIVV